MPSVLIVDGGEDMRWANMLSLQLKAADYCVTTALSLKKARAYLARGQPDVILLNVALPDGDGIDFCAKLQGVTDAHILFCTSRHTDDEEQRALASGGDYYLSKSIRMELITARIEAAIRQRKRTRRSGFEA